MKKVKFTLGDERFLDYQEKIVYYDDEEDNRNIQEDFEDWVFDNITSAWYECDD